MDPLASSPDPHAAGDADDNATPTPFGLPDTVDSAECHLYRTGTNGQGQVLSIYTNVYWTRGAPPTAQSSMMRFAATGVADPGSLTPGDHVEHRLLTQRDAQDFARFCEEQANAELGDGAADLPELPPRRRAPRVVARAQDPDDEAAEGDPYAPDPLWGAPPAHQPRARRRSPAPAPAPAPARAPAPAQHQPYPHSHAHARAGVGAARPKRARHEPYKPVSWPSAWQFGDDPKDLLERAQMREQRQGGRGV